MRPVKAIDAKNQFVTDTSSFFESIHNNINGPQSIFKDLYKRAEVAQQNTYTFEYGNNGYYIKATILATQKAMYFETYTIEISSSGTKIEGDRIDELTVLFLATDNWNQEGKITIKAKFPKTKDADFFSDHIGSKYAEKFQRYIEKKEKDMLALLS